MTRWIPVPVGNKCPFCLHPRNFRVYFAEVIFFFLVICFSYPLSVLSVSFHILLTPTFNSPTTQRSPTTNFTVETSRPVGRELRGGAGCLALKHLRAIPPFPIVCLVFSIPLVRSMVGYSRLQPLTPLPPFVSFPSVPSTPVASCATAAASVLSRLPGAGQKSSRDTLYD